jgi:hypothetical protein
LTNFAPLCQDEEEGKALVKEEEKVEPQKEAPKSKKETESPQKKAPAPGLTGLAAYAATVKKQVQNQPLKASPLAPSLAKLQRSAKDASTAATASASNGSTPPQSAPGRLHDQADDLRY